MEDVFGSEFANLKAGELPSINELIEHSWSKMKFNYGTGTKGRSYQEEEDAFLVAMMYRHGYGAAERIRMSIRRAWQFRFDWYFKSRSAQEIQKRCDVIVKIIEKENEDIREERKKKQEEEKVESMQSESSTVNNAQVGDATAAISAPTAAASPGNDSSTAVPAENP